jgi:multidrug efflux pump subunit AcrB
MWLILGALRRPVTVLVLVIAFGLTSILAVKRMSVDIFPDLNLPVIYVAQPYGGMDPGQMESFFVSYYEYHFLYVNGIEHVESKSIQGVGLLKLYFHPGTDMNQALAQVIAYVERSRAFMPPGTVSPFVVRFDGGSVPVGNLVFTSETKTLGEIQDLALFRVRPVFATLPGVSAPPPFGGNQRTVVVRVDPDRLRAFGMSPDEVAKALATGNTILPSGNVRTGVLNRLAPVNAVVPNISELADLPIRVGSGTTVRVRDVGTVENSSDILTGYALVNGRRTVYIPVTKRADASTLDVVKRVKLEIPRMQSLIPKDIKVTFELDQSGYVTNAVKGLIVEGVLGALLTGLMILLFLRDIRSVIVVVVTIPSSLLVALVGMWLSGQTINIMSLGGLALAIGILVDEATVEIENIHAHLGRGEKLSEAVFQATLETVTPRFLALVSVLAVFVPAFFLTGVTRALFVPLAIAVGFAMAASYLLSSTLVPILTIYTHRGRETGHRDGDWFVSLLNRYSRVLDWIFGHSRTVWAAYLILVVGVGLGFGRTLGQDLFPRVEADQIQFRLRAPTGTRVEETESLALKALEAVKAEVGNDNIDITLGYVGTQPPSYPINTIYQWTSGSHEAVLSVGFRKSAGIDVPSLKERLRKRLTETLPGTALSFESADIVSQILNFGAPTPIEVAMSGPDLAANRAFAEKVLAEMKSIPALRDVQFGQPLDYPTLEIQIDRERAGQQGVTVDQVARSLVEATGSSRFTQPNYWRDPKSGVAYQIQVEVPQSLIKSPADVESIPAMPSGAAHPLVGEVATVRFGTMPGEYDRYNQQRMITVTANIHRSDLGSVTRQVEAAVRRAGEPPRGVRVEVRGQSPRLDQTISGIRSGSRIDRHPVAPDRQFSIDPDSAGRADGRSGGSLRCRHRSFGHRHDPEYPVLHGDDHGHRGLGFERHFAGDLRRGSPPGWRFRG